MRARQTAAFLKQSEKVDKLRKKLRTEVVKLQQMCNHVFPGGTSFTDCEYCGMSSYYFGQEELLE